MKNHLRGAFFICLLGSLAPLPALAQSIHGQILVAGDTVGIDGVTLTVTDAQGTLLFTHQTDEMGLFRVGLDAPGLYGISATRLGFATTQALVRVQDREMVVVEMRMAQEAIPLEPLEIVARRRIREGTLDEFYDRMARMKQKGRGYFITRDEIEGSGGASIPTLLHRVPGVFLQPAGITGQAVKMRRPGTFCTPQVFVDGRPQSWAVAPVMEDLEGVEVYRGRFEFVEGYWPNDCGMIFLWRKKDWGNRPTWKRFFAFGGFGAFFLAVALLA